MKVGPEKTGGDSEDKHGGGLPQEAELDEFGTVISRFVYGLRPNVPELIVRSDDTYRVITDERGSPVYVVGITHGNVLLEASYDEWGVPYDVTVDGVYQNDSVAGWPIPHGFAGGLFDEGTGLVRFGARDFSPEMGRWTAKDPILFDGGQSNLYVYVNNDPVQFTDPEGLFVPAILAAPVIVEGLLWGAAGAAALYTWAELEVGTQLWSATQSVWDSLSLITKQESPIWNALDPYRGKTRTNGSGGSRRFYEWDHTHNDIEVYDNRGNHLGSMDGETGEMCKPRVKGRKIRL